MDRERESRDVGEDAVLVVEIKESHYEKRTLLSPNEAARMRRLMATLEHDADASALPAQPPARRRVSLLRTFLLALGALGALASILSLF